MAGGKVQLKLDTLDNEFGVYKQYYEKLQNALSVLNDKKGMTIQVDFFSVTITSKGMGRTGFHR
jgi:hypothetical protein